MEYLINLRQHKKLTGIGNKAESLKKLISLGFNVPTTFVLSYDIQSKYLERPTETKSRLLAEITDKLSCEKTYAVRSSSSLEDSSERSYAGQFTSFLNIGNAQDIMEKITQVWASLSMPDQSIYAQKPGESKNPSMAVIIQEMVQAAWSGVAFSINPVSGRSQTIIEAVKGSGESLVQKGVTPMRWTLNNGEIEGDEIKNGLGKEVLIDIETQLKNLCDKVKSQIDVEWVYDGNELYFVQWRPVTVSRFPVIFSNHISREVLPGMIKPLVWSVNIPLVNSAWIKLIEKIMGKLDLSPQDLSSSFYYRAYFNMGTFGALFKKLGLPPNSLENLMGRKKSSKKGSFKPSFKALIYLPTLTVFLIHFYTLLRRFRKQIKRFYNKTTELEKALNDRISLANYQSHFNAIDQHCRDISYYNIVIPLYMNISNTFLQKKLTRNDLSLEALDMAADFPEIKDYDPNPSLQFLGNLWNGFSKETQNMIIEEGGSFDQNIKGLDQFRHGIETFNTNFGHFSESGNDFSYPQWKENTDYIINMIKHFPSHEKDSASKEQSTVIQKVRKSSVYKRAAKMRLYREMISSLYTKTYGLFRILFLDMGRQLVELGKLDNAEDIFYIDLDYLDKLVESKDQNFIRDAKTHIEKVKKEMSELREIDLPSIIYGEQPPQISGIDTTDIYHGIPASIGYFEGEIRVIKSLDDFDHMIDNAILVIPYSDVSWTPILLRAGAIVSESGGILSHASIIAREMGIPAIVSVDHACRIKEGIKATVDGQNGILILQD
jgi:pyruvate,water dikinase